MVAAKQLWKINTRKPHPMIINELLCNQWYSVEIEFIQDISN